MLAAAGTWLMQVATGRSRRSGKRSDEELVLFLGRGRGSRPRRLAAAGDGAGRRRQVPRARPAAGSLLQMTSLHGICVASSGGRPGGPPTQGAGEAAQDVAELRRRPRGRAPRLLPRSRGRQEAGAQGARDVVGAEETSAGAAPRGGEAGGGGGRAAPVICLGDSPARLPVESQRRGSWQLVGLCGCLCTVNILQEI